MNAETQVSVDGKLSMGMAQWGMSTTHRAHVKWICSCCEIEMSVTILKDNAK